MHSRFVRRLTMLTLALPFCYFGTASATFLYRLHSQNTARARVPADRLAAAAITQRILVVSPHPDDETLGCGGMLQSACASGAGVRVVFLTNGDGFRVAVERQFREARVGPDDYVRFAAIRQEEARRALRDQGVPASDITFLGYPDRGLMAMWEGSWTPDQAYRSAYTRTSACPYPVTYHPGAAYCGQNLLDDLESILREQQPTDVFVTHPSDDHPDHSAAAAFVGLALVQLREQGLPWARTCRLRYYLVHRGDWPVPQGLYRGDPLAPPAEMAGLDTHWQAFALTGSQVRRKLRGVQQYASQTAVMQRFLVSFARSNELFGELPEVTIPRVPDSAIQADGQLADWRALQPVVRDPVNDSLVRDFERGADLKAVYACRDTTNLYLRVETYRSVSDRAEFAVRIRYVGDAARSQAGGTCTVVVRPPRQVVPADLQMGSASGGFELAIPLRRLDYAHLLALNVESRFAGILVDRTGYRFLSE